MGIRRKTRASRLALFRSPARGERLKRNRAVRILSEINSSENPLNSGGSYFYQLLHLGIQNLANQALPIDDLQEVAERCGLE